MGVLSQLPSTITGEIRTTIVVILLSAGVLSPLPSYSAVTGVIRTAILFSVRVFYPSYLVLYPGFRTAIFSLAWVFYPVLGNWDTSTHAYPPGWQGREGAGHLLAGLAEGGRARGTYPRGTYRRATGEGRRSKGGRLRATGDGRPSKGGRGRLLTWVAV